MSYSWCPQTPTGPSATFGVWQHQIDFSPKWCQKEVAPYLYCANGGFPERHQRSQRAGYWRANPVSSSHSLSAFLIPVPQTRLTASGPVSVIAGGQVRQLKILSPHENREISKDRDSSAFSTRFAQILVPLARKYVLAVAISRASVANSRWARKFSEPTAVEQFVRKGLGPSIAVSNRANR